MSYGRTPAAVDALGASRRAAAKACAWCAGPIPLRSRGPIAKWCSPRCRREAWVQAHAAASDRGAVVVVERIVEAPSNPGSPRHGEWVDVLHELTRQLDTGLLYDRDLAGMARALDEVVEAFDRRARFRRVTRRLFPAGRRRGDVSLNLP